MNKKIIIPVYSDRELTGRRPIITASRNTDIPAFYSDWFFERLDAGFVDIPKQGDEDTRVRVSLKRGDVSGYVFWTKNLAPMMPRIEELKEKCGAFYFHYTLNGYGRDVEPNLPDWQERVEGFRRLSESLATGGRRDKVIWRYDPIFVNVDYTMGWHIDNFARTAKALQGATLVCVASFINLGTPAAWCRMERLLLHQIKDAMKIELMLRFKEIAARYGIQLTSCSEAVDMSACGIEKAHCISDKIFDHYCLLGWPDAIDLVGVEGITDEPSRKRDGSYRPFCGCVKGIDIGARNTCGHGCLYCHACDEV